MNTGFEGLSEESSEEPHSKGLTQTAADFKLVAGSRASQSTSYSHHHHYNQNEPFDSLLAVLINLPFFLLTESSRLASSTAKCTLAVPTQFVHHSQLITGIRPILDVTTAELDAIKSIKNLNSKLDPCNSQYEPTIAANPSQILCELFDILCSFGLSLLRNPIKTRALQRILSEFSSSNSRSAIQSSSVDYLQCRLHRPTLRPLQLAY